MSKMPVVNFFAKREARPSRRQETVTVKDPKSSLLATTDADSIPFSELSAVLDKIEGTTKRLEITEHLTEFFVRIMGAAGEQEGRVNDVVKLGPDYEGLELGLGEQLLMKVIVTGTGRTMAKVKADLHSLGDIGLVAAASKSNQNTVFKPQPLTIATLFKGLVEIATASGANAVHKKIDGVRGLLSACEGNEAKLLAGKLRIGLAEQSILSALALSSAKLHPRPGEDPVPIIKSVYNSIPNYELIIPQLVKHGVWELAQYCKMTPGIPLKPMLAFPTKSIGEVLDRFESMTFTCEYKYDGERAQIHRKPDGSIAIYSRNSEDMLQKYPDIANDVPLFAKDDVQDYVLDCEVVAWDTKQQKLLPFQILSTRKRKDVTVESVEVRVVVFAFDVLYLNGRPLMQESLRERRALLMAHFHEVPGMFHFACHRDTNNVDDIQAFLEEAVQHGCEGLMVKTLDTEATYEPSKRSRHWLKIKKDYLKGIGDSVDLVPIGGYLGKGKRTGVYGGYLLACWNPDAEEFQAVCKIGTGFSEERLEEQAAYFKDHLISEPRAYYRVGEGVKPDVWFDATQVWEVKAADFSLSPVYQAAWGMVEGGKGISLRFPRYIRLRDDKAVEDATTAAQLAEMYGQQASVAGKAEEEDDYY